MNEHLKPCRNFYRREIPLNMPPASIFMYRQGNNMTPRFEPACIFSADGFDAEFSSEDVIIVGNHWKNKYLLAGAVTAHRSLTFFTLIKKASNMHSIEVRQPDIMEGDTPEEILILEGDDWRKLIQEYAAVTAQKMNVKQPDTQKNLTGYCTWYYYYKDVTEKDFLENLQAMKDHRSSCYQAQVIQIDDGYQTFQGDWNDQDDSWPTPLATIAGQITDAGMTAGIWLMPFQASTASRVFKEHPDWFVKNENGEPKVAFGWSPPPDDLWACLDTTQVAVQEHLAKVFKTFRSWGFRYFKMDGLGFGLMPGKRSDPDATPVSAFRLGLKAIRDAVPDAILLGCCPPFMACLGYIDSARISGDTAAHWPAIQHAARAVTSRWWMFDKFFRCDPDTLMARQDRSTASIGEARISVLTGIMTDVSITSDNLNTIAAERLELLGRGANIRMRDPVPLPWDLNSWPQVFTGTVDGKKAVAIINEKEQDVEYKFEDLTLDPRKEAEEILHPQGLRKYVITVKAHDAVLLVQD